MAKRVSISPAQAQTGAAAELVALLQTVSADGKISASEIKTLHRWIKANEGCGLPGMQLLKETIEFICADGRVTPEERDELAKVVERVLPPDLRALAKQRRKLESLAERERQREAKREAAKRDAAALEASKAESALKDPVFEFDFLVAGVAHEGRAMLTSRMMEGETVFIIRDRANAHSPNAVEVRTATGFQIGFVPEADAVQLAPYLDHGYRHIAWVKKIWEGRSIPIPVVIAQVFPPDTQTQAAISEGQVPAKRTVPSSKKSCLVPLIAAGSLVALLGYSASKII